MDITVFIYTNDFQSECHGAVLGVCKREMHNSSVKGLGCAESECSVLFFRVNCSNVYYFYISLRHVLTAVCFHKAAVKNMQCDIKTGLLRT